MRTVWNIDVTKHRLPRAVYHQWMTACVNRWEKLDCSEEYVQGVYAVVASHYASLTKFCEGRETSLEVPNFQTNRKEKL